MICGNKVGGGSSEKTYIITNQDESISLIAVAVDELTVFDAKCNDVASGKKFVGDGGISIGTNDVPLCRDISGVHEVYPDVEVLLILDKNDMWDYSYLQGFITTKADPYNVVMLIMDDAVYRNGQKVADVKKNKDNKSIEFNITNDSDEIYLLHYFICKEED